MLKDKAKPNTNARVVPERQRTGGRNSPIEFAFTTPLQLEECLARLEQKQHAWVSNVRVELSKVNDTLYQFRITNRANIMDVEAIGTLQCWEGTATLIKGRAKLLFVWLDEIVKFWLTIIVVPIFIMMLLKGVWIGAGLLVGFACIAVYIMNWQEKRHNRLIDILQDTVAPKRGKKHG